LDDDDELHFGVNEQMLYARNVPAVDGAQWTGIITQVRGGGQQLSL
jgi:7-hydroxymethyl chlorophyll a reductase